MLTDLLQAHDVPMIGLAFLLSITLTHGALLLAPRGRTVGSRRSWARAIFAGLLLGLTIWTTFLVALHGFFPFLPASVPWSAAAVSALLSVAGGIAAIVTTVFRERSARNAMLAGSAL